MSRGRSKASGMKDKPSLQEIVDSWAPKRAWDAQYPFVYYFCKPVSFPLTYLAARLPVTPNQVTFMSYLVAVYSCILLVKGYPNGFLWGAVVFIAFIVVDCVDGNLARVRGMTSPEGQFLDGLITPFLQPLVFLAVGTGLWLGGPNPQDRLLAGLAGTGGTGPFLWFVAGSLSAVAFLMTFGVRAGFYARLEERWREVVSPGGPSNFDRLSTFSSSLPYLIYTNLSRTSTQAPLLLLSALLDAVSFWLLFFFLMTALELLLNLIVFVRRALFLARRADPDNS